MPGRCRRDRRGTPVLDGLQLRRVLHAQADMHAGHPRYGAIDGLGVGDRAFGVLETLPEPLPGPPSVTHEQAYLVV